MLRELLSIFRDDVKEWLYDSAFTQGLAEEAGGDHDYAALMTDPYADPRLRAEVDRRMFTDVRTYLPGALLPKVDRTALVLFYLEEMSGEEVAAHLGIKTKSLHVRLHRARKKLKSILENEVDA